MVCVWATKGKKMKEILMTVGKKRRKSESKTDYVEINNGQNDSRHSMFSNLYSLKIEKLYNFYICTCIYAVAITYNLPWYRNE